MKIALEEFKNILSTKKYLFHLHTDYTDGLNSVEDYFNYASKYNFDVIIFTEHVRKNIKYDFEKFLLSIQKCHIAFSQVEPIIGVEAKILPDGTLDIPETILSKIKLICIACHSFPSEIELYRNVLENVFSDGKWKKYHRVWVHPGRFLRKNNLLEHEHGETVLRQLVDYAVNEGVLIEVNQKDKLPPPSALEGVSSHNLIIGHDAHAIDHIKMGLSYGW